MDKQERQDRVSLHEIAREQLAAATADSAGRAARTLVGGHDATLRQTVIALTRGRELSEHENPGSATVQVLQGSVELTSPAAADSPAILHFAARHTGVSRQECKIAARGGLAERGAGHDGSSRSAAGLR